MDGDALIGYLVRMKHEGEDGVNIPLLMRKSYYIGRGADCEIRLKNPDVGERHCMIEISQLKTVTVHSLDPEFPVLINEKEINGEGYPLEHGDIIKISDLHFKWMKGAFEDNGNGESLTIATRLSLCSENVPKVLRAQGRHSAPEFLSNEGGLDENERFEDSVASKTDSEEEIFSDALTLEDISSMNDDNQVSPKATVEVHTSNENIPKESTQLDDSVNVLHAELESVTSGNNASKNDVTRDVEEILNKNEISSVPREVQNSQNVIEEVSDVELNIPEKSFSSSFVKTGITNAQDSILRTPKHSEKVEYPTSVTRSSSKLKNDGTSFSSSNVLPEKDTSLQTSEDQPVSNDSVIEGSNANEDHFNSTKTKTVLDADQNMTPEKENSNDTTDRNAQNSISKTPKCFEEAYHSTPNARSKSKRDEEVTPEPLDFPSKSLAESTPDVVESPAKLRGRRSTGIECCVGTPSDVYRCKRSILTPAVRLSRDSVLKDDILSAQRLPRRRSSERKSTPLKVRMSDKSIQRESILHSPIIEDEASEKCEESQNESYNNDSKFKFVQSRRRQRFRGSSFVVENRILEESETSQNDMTGGTVNDLNEEEDKSLIALSSCDDSEIPMSARIIINGDRSEENENEEEDELNSTFTIDTTEVQKEDSPVKDAPSLKSILTPLPKAAVTNKEKSVKKVTFAHNVIAESYEQGSMDSSQSVDSSNMSIQQSSYNSIDVTDTSSNLCSKIEDGLDSFCKHEELLLSERSQSSVFSQNSTSTPVKAHNNTSVSSEKSKSVTRFLDTWEKSYESTRTPCNSRNDQSSAISLTGISMEDDVDLTALQDAEKEQSESGVSVNKTNEQSASSIKDMTEEFLTPASSKLGDTLDDMCENKTPGSTMYSQNYSSISDHATSTIFEGKSASKSNEETLEGVADLLQTPRVTLSKLNETANSVVSTPHLDNVKSSTGVTPQLKQLKLNKTVDSTFDANETVAITANTSQAKLRGTPYVRLTDISTGKSTNDVNTCVDITSSTPNLRSKRSVAGADDASNKSARSIESTPRPRLNRTVNSSKGTPYPKLSTTRSTNVSKLTKMNETVDSTRGTPCSKTPKLNKTVESAKRTPCLKLNKTVDSVKGTPYPKLSTTRSANNSKLTNMNETGESTRGTSCLKTSKLNETVESVKSPPHVNSTISREGTPCIKLRKLDETVNGMDGIAELPESPKELSPEKEKILQDTSGCEKISKNTSESEIEVFAEEENSANIELRVTESPTIAEEAPEVEDSNAASLSEAIEEAATQDVSEIEILQGAETQLVTEQLETQEMSELALEGADTQIVSEIKPIEEVDTQDVSEMEIIENADTQYVSEVEMIENADTQYVSETEMIENADTQYVSEAEIIENVDTQTNTQDTFELQLEEAATQLVEENVMQKVSGPELIEEVATQLVTENMGTQNYPEPEPIEEVATQAIIEEAVTQDSVDDNSKEFIRPVSTQVVSEKPIWDVIGEIATPNIVKEMTGRNDMEETETHEFFENVSTQDFLEKPITQDIMEDTETRDIEDAETLDADTQDVENAETQNIIEEVETRDSTDHDKSQDIVEEVATNEVSKETEVPEVSEEAETQFILSEIAEPETIEEAETQTIVEYIAEKIAQQEVCESKTAEIVIEEVCPRETTKSMPESVSDLKITEVTAETTKITDQSTITSASVEESRAETSKIVLESVSKSEVTGVAVDAAKISDQSTALIEEVEPDVSSVEKMQSEANTIVDSVVDEDVLTNEDGSVDERNEEIGERVEKTDSVVVSTITTAQVEEPECEEKSEEEEPKRTSLLEVVLTRAETPKVRRSRRISKAVDPEAVDPKRHVASEVKIIRMSTRRTRTPKRLESDQEKSATKRTRKDRDNQENENRFSIFHRQCSFCDCNPILIESSRKRIRNNEEITPQKRGRTSLKKDVEKLTLLKPVFSLPKIEVQLKINNVTETVAQKSPLQVASSPMGSKRRALRKLDDNSEVVKSPSRMAQSDLIESVSPFSILLPILSCSSNESVNDENAHVSKNRSTAVKVDNSKLPTKQKRGSRKRSENSEEAKAKVTTQDVNKRTRVKKSSTGSDVSETSTSGRTNKRATKKSDNVVTSPASTSSQVESPSTKAKTRGNKKTNSQIVSPTCTSSLVGSPKRATRKRRNADEDLPVQASQPKRMLRGRRAAPTTEEKPVENEVPVVALDTKSKRTTRGSREKLNENISEVKSKRTTRTKPAVAEVAEPVEIGRATRPKRNASALDKVVEAEKKKVTRAGRQKLNEVVEEEPPKNKRVAKNREPVPSETESTSSKRSTRSKRTTSEVESVSSDVRETKPRAEVKGRSAPSVNTSKTNDENEVKRTTRARTTRTAVVKEPTDAPRSTRSKKGGPSVTVSRMSLKLKVVKKRSSTKEASLIDDEEPRRKRVKICNSNDDSFKARSKNRSSVKAVISKNVTRTTTKTKSEANRPVTRRSCLKTAGTNVSANRSPSTKTTTRSTRSTKTEVAKNGATSRTTRRK